MAYLRDMHNIKNLKEKLITLRTLHQNAFYQLENFFKKVFDKASEVQFHSADIMTLPEFSFMVKDANNVITYQSDHLDNPIFILFEDSLLNGIGANQKINFKDALVEAVNKYWEPVYPLSFKETALKYDLNKDFNADEKNQIVFMIAGEAFFANGLNGIFYIIYPTEKIEENLYQESVNG